MISKSGISGLVDVARIEMSLLGLPTGCCHITTRSHLLDITTVIMMMMTMTMLMNVDLLRSKATELIFVINIR